MSHENDRNAPCPAPPATASKGLVPALSADPGAPPLRMLILDDDPRIRSYVQRMGEQLGYEVTSCADGESFRRTFRSCDPHVILLDLVVPDTDGVEMLKFLATQHCLVPVLLMSGMDERTIHAAKRLGDGHGLRMFGGLEKPFSTDALKSELRAAGIERMNLAKSDLLRALAAGELELHYQPQVLPWDEGVVGAEALLRWDHPDYGMLLPGYFLPFVESTEDVRDLTRWVAREAFRQQRAWRERGLNLSLSVNLSMRDILDPALPDELAALAAEERIDPGSIVLEVIEREATHDLERTTEVLTRLRLKGFQLAVDDFGTGYSSLAMLQVAPFCELKIDKCFVMNARREPESRVIVQSVVNLGHNLGGQRVVAEGVEDRATLDLMSELGVDIIQGFHTGRPMPAADLERRIERSAVQRRSA